MLSFLKLVRVQNLLIIAFTQYMVRWCLIYPILKARSLELQLSDLNFFLLVLSTVMIAAAGYAINDYFDIKIDKINKPQQILIDRAIKRRVAMGAHTVINLVAILIALYVSNEIGLWKLALIHILCAGGLWFYSTDFKRQLLLGNIIIALFTALVPFIVGVYELLPCYKHYLSIFPELSFKTVWYHIWGISFFAFITTLIREIIKDIEDIEGDSEYGCKTLPIVVGKNISKFIVIVLILVTMGCLFYFQLFQWKYHDWPSFYYFTFALQIPFLFLIYNIIKAQTADQYGFSAKTVKFIMLMGICYLLVFAYSLLKYIDAIQQA